MSLSLADAGLLLVSFVLPLALVLITTPPFKRYLIRSGKVVDDVHKRPPTKVPTPAGPVLVVAAVVGEVAVYAFSGSLVPVAVAAAAAVAFTIGMVDDLYVLGGLTKPMLLLLAGVPLVVLQQIQSSLYVPALSFPFLGDTNPHFIIYTVLAVAAFPIVANAFNMMDSFNGQISWFTLLAAAAVLLGVALRTWYAGSATSVQVAAVLPLIGTSLGLLIFNRYPSSIFDGDSGSLMFGSMFAALAVTCGVEVAAIIAIVPAILNSFYTLSSVRGFVERRRMATRPTYIGDDGKLYANTEGTAPNTLVRLILLDGPLTEKQLVSSLLSLTAFACLLSVLISFMTWVL